jgi:prolyl-tRNA editing enzyme YbaK/EbsC (Cys-tRNA(Pro) deacylase)
MRGQTNSDLLDGVVRMQEISPSARKVQEALDSLGLLLEVVELPGSTRTAVEAAAAIGCSVAQIVKSIVFKGKHSGAPILVIASGANRISEVKVEALIGEPLGKADADFVRQQTGFVIGGVPPVGHVHLIRTFIDKDLFEYKEIWAAAGTPHAVFRLTPGDLLQMSQGDICDILA